MPRLSLRLILSTLSDLASVHARAASGDLAGKVVVLAPTD